MSSRSHNSGWITTSKSSKPSALKSQHAPLPKLHQSSLYDFMKRKPKTKHRQKENASFRTISKFTRQNRVETEYWEQGSVAEKCNQHGEAPRHSEDASIDEPLRRSNRIQDDRLNIHSSLPDVVRDSPDVVSWDGTTVLDSSTSSRSFGVESDASPPITLKQTRRPTKRDGTRVRNFSAIFKVPAQPTAPRFYGGILAPDTPRRRNNFVFDEDPFVVSPIRNDASDPTTGAELIPSSQSQEIELSVQHIDKHFLIPSTRLDVNLHSPSHARQQLEPMSDEFVPSSQSQYLLPYSRSPFRTSRSIGSSDSVAIGADIVPSSQNLQEMELKVPFLYHQGSSRIEQSNVLGSLAPPVMSPSSTHSTQTLTTPSNKGSRSHEHSTPACPSSPTMVSMVSSPSTPGQAKTFTSAIISTSPPPMAASQYSYLSSDSYPPEMKKFLSMLDEDRCSLGPDFHDPSLTFESPRASESHAVTTLSRSFSTPQCQTNSSEPLSESSLPPESMSTQCVLHGHEPEYTFVEELCPQVVTDFLDMLNEDRASLGSLFQEYG